MEMARVGDDRAARWARLGMTWALFPALALLFLLAVYLLRSDGSTPKVLVAVWLWTLPILGTFAAAGWLTGRLAASASRGRPAALASEQTEE